jgi:hypothetical protein
VELLNSIVSLIDFVLLHLFLLILDRSYEVGEFLQRDSLGAVRILSLNSSDDCDNHIVCNLASLRLQEYLKVLDAKLLVLIHIQLSKKLEDR